MSKFKPSYDDLFGNHCEIEMKFYGKEGNKKHLFKVIGKVRSNYYYDVPLNKHTKPAYIHDELIEVVNVIECGIDESEVIRVPLKDIELINKQTNYKTLEELGFVEIPKLYVKAIKSYSYFRKENVFGDFITLVSFMDNGEYIVEENAPNIKPRVNYELHKAIELKMIELGVKDDV